MIKILRKDSHGASFSHCSSLGGKTKAAIFLRTLYGIIRFDSVVFSLTEKKIQQPFFYFFCSVSAEESFDFSMMIIFRYL